MVVLPIASYVKLYLLPTAEAPVATYNVKQTFESRLLPGLKIRVAKIFQR